MDTLYIYFPTFVSQKKTGSTTGFSSTSTSHRPPLAPPPPPPARAPTPAHHVLLIRYRQKKHSSFLLLRPVSIKEFLFKLELAIDKSTAIDMLVFGFSLIRAHIIRFITKISKDICRINSAYKKTFLLKALKI